jgi:mitogen-activated protein kinase 1/3/mitogen-activated protein kinase 6
LELVSYDALMEYCIELVQFFPPGAYGVVCAAHDDDSNAYVAIKKCKKVFHSRTLAKRTLRELRLLRLMNHENVVKLISILLPSPSSADFNEIYVVFEIMETDLATIIKSPQPLNNQHIQYFMYQLLVALKYIHDLKIIHRDLKPRLVKTFFTSNNIININYHRNLLVNSNCSLKIADFGLARVYNPQNDKKIAPMTEYVTTRWYRAPEILVGWPRYSSAVDIWAAGTILAELIGR